VSRLIIGVTGRKRAGKDSVAARLVERHGFVRYAFADSVRRVALAIDPIVDVDHWMDEEYRLSVIVAERGWERTKDEIPEVRRLLQTIGTDAIRALDPDFWVRATMRQVYAEARPVVITDVRFPNEAEAVKRAGGVLVRVVRPGQTDDDQHASETAMDGQPVAYLISNEGTPDDLNRATDLVAGIEKEVRG
jgi:hypothetical protein